MSSRYLESCGISPPGLLQEELKSRGGGGYKLSVMLFVIRPSDGQAALGIGAGRGGAHAQALEDRLLSPLGGFGVLVLLMQSSWLSPLLSRKFL